MGITTGIALAVTRRGAALTRGADAGAAITPLLGLAEAKLSEGRARQVTRLRHTRKPWRRADSPHRTRSMGPFAQRHFSREATTQSRCPWQYQWSVTPPPRSLRSTMSFKRELIHAPLYVIFGLFVFLGALVRLVRALTSLGSLGRTFIKCSTCGAPNDIYSRWSCSDCGAEYLGAVHLCTICGSSASWFPCCRCRTSIGLRTR